MTNEYEYTRNLDLLGDWLDAKGYGEEAGLITRSMDYMHKQAARIAELTAALKPFADEAQFYHPMFKDEELAAENTFDFTIGDLRAARAAYLGEKE